MVLDTWLEKKKKKKKFSKVSALLYLLHAITTCNNFETFLPF